MNFCLHGTNRTVKNTDSHAQRKTQCECLTTGLQVTAGTTATVYILNQTGRCQLNLTLRNCHGALRHLLHSTVLEQPHKHTHTQHKPQKVSIKIHVLTGRSILTLLSTFLLLWWHYSAMHTFTSWMDFSQSVLSCDVSLQFVILYLLVTAGTQFHRLFFGHPLSQLPWGLMWNTWLTYLLPSSTYFTLHLLTFSL